MFFVLMMVNTCASVGKAPFRKEIPPLEEMSRSDKGGAASARGCRDAPLCGVTEDSHVPFF